jgi:hypothetical protein
MRRRGTFVVLAAAAVFVFGACSGGDDTQGDRLDFVELPAPPRALNQSTPFVENADTVIALIEGRLFRYDPWDAHPTWLEVERGLPTAKSRLVSWNDRVWYLTTDRGQLEIASVALSGDRRSDTRVVAGATDEPLALVAARTAIYTLSEHGGFRIDGDGIYADVPPPPTSPAIADWSKAIVAELDDGTIAIASENELRLLYEPDVRQWREPSAGLAPAEILTITVTSEGLLFVAGTPPRAHRLSASNRLDALEAPLDANCTAPSVYTSDLGAIAVGCGTAVWKHGDQTRRVDVPAGTSIVAGPRGRPLAIAAAKGEISLLR